MPDCLIQQVHANPMDALRAIATVRPGPDTDYRKLAAMMAAIAQVAIEQPGAKVADAAPRLLIALRLAVAELRAMRADHYPDCDGDCPTLECITLADDAIAAATA